MKIKINKSAKRVLSIALALAMVIGTLFTANIGFNINANAADDGYVYDTWDGSSNTSFSGGTGVAGDPYIIETCEQLYAVTANKVTTDGVYFKVKDGVDAFYMQSESLKSGIDALTTAAEVKDFYEANAASCRIYWSNGTFQGNFDGNGATVYGLYTGGSQSTFGLFHQINGGTIKNVSVMKGYANCSGFAGAVVGVSSWGTVYSTTIENCVVALNYINSTGTKGAIIGHAGNDPVTVKNCLVYDNAGNISQIIGYTDATTGNTVEDTVAIGVKTEIGQTCTYIDCYTDQSVSTSGVTVLPAESMKGVMAQVNMPGLDWATDSEDGFWYVSESGYPANIKPEGWTYIEAPDIWDGTAATEFAGGKGTKDDPYIIETAAQLRKMVLEGGRIDTGKTKQVDNNGTKVTVKVYEKAYYKVADGVTDIYLSPVVGGTLDILKDLVSAGSNKVINWTAGLFTNASFSADTDGDGIRDQATAFRGEFDGNGVTIHGLYSKTVDRGWNNEGVGFVPALMDDAVIKNVTFDKAFIHNTGYTYAGVITASLGYDDTKATNTDLDPSTSGGQTVNGSTVAVTSVGIHNVTVKNSRVQTNSTSGFGGVAGFVASHGTPAACSFTNCLFDSSNELVVPDGFAPDAGTGKGGFINLGQSGTQHFYFENCVSLGVYPDNKANDYPQYVNCYTSEASTKSGLVGGITEYSADTMPNLNWTQWSVIDGMLAVTGNSAAYSHATNWKEAIAYTNESRWSLSQPASSVGNWTMIGAHEDGVYINYENMQGSGTKDDPYLISDALTLARVIGSGGTNYTEKLYFKLTNDINVGGLRWIDQKDYAIDSNGDGVLDDPKYSYRPFAGVLDGDGYAVTGLYANSEDSAGLIPVLAGGTVKNLHVRDACVVANG
ncbi:MAG: hypothetical protein E7521_05055, partial [Ruminococcaceae bacterium]|nr:hypothetical protein [Oscillospiraceae bacterium]